MNYLEEIASAIFAEAHPDEQLEVEQQPLYLIYAVLALSVGKDVSTKNVHDAWAAWQTSAKPTHPSLRHYDELSPDVQLADEPYRKAIATVAIALEAG